MIGFIVGSYHVYSPRLTLTIFFIRPKLFVVKQQNPYLLRRVIKFVIHNGRRTSVKLTYINKIKTLYEYELYCIKITHV